MLSSLTIKNFGLIDRLTVDLGKGLNVLTGETGAGKSILIDALQIVLGNKLNISQVRDKESPCVIEAVFDLSPQFLKKHPPLSEHVSKDDPLLIINRTFFADGRGKNKINGLTVTVSELKNMGNYLVDLHGPHDHQMLLSEDLHLDILDSLTSIETDKKEYSELFNSYTKLKKELDTLTGLAENSERELDILTHQIKELEQVPLSETEYEKLSQESSRINNSEKLHESASRLLDLLENEENGMNRISSQAFTFMNTLSSTDEATSPFTDILTRIQEDSSELSASLSDYLETLSFDPRRSDEVNRRLDIYYDLIRKYGPSMENVSSF
ncbi:MAG: AAA family ATPase, partial [Candidatus Omnitrophota bacterium]